MIIAVPGAEVILITCIPRYILVPCCGDHCKWSAEEKTRLLADLTTMKKNIRSQLFMEKLPKVRIVDPMMVCSLDSTESYTDEVHLSATEYEKIANAVVDLVAGQIQEGQPNTAPSQPAKRARLSTGGQPTAVGAGRGGEGERRQGPLPQSQGLLVGARRVCKKYVIIRCS